MAAINFPKTNCVRSNGIRLEKPATKWQTAGSFVYILTFPKYREKQLFSQASLFDVR